MLKHVLACAAGSLMMANVAAASVTFSFASDSHLQGPVFMGDQVAGQNQLTNFAPLNNLTLLVDPDNTVPGGVTSFDASFNFSASTSAYQSSSFGGVTVHQWVLNGSFQFVDTISNLDILTVNFNQAIMTNVSSSGSSLGSSATLQSSFDVDPGLTFTAGAALNLIGITSADISSMQDFAFTLTSIREHLTNNLPVLGAGGDWTMPWTSEASFSATAVPVPGVLALFAMAGLTCSRRRRAG